MMSLWVLLLAGCAGPGTTINRIDKGRGQPGGRGSTVNGHGQGRGCGRGGFCCWLVQPRGHSSPGRKVWIVLAWSWSWSWSWTPGRARSLLRIRLIRWPSLLRRAVRAFITCQSAGRLYRNSHETRQRLAGDGGRSPEIAAELLGVGLRGTRWGSTRQGQGLSEAVRVGLNALQGQTRTCPSIALPAVPSLPPGLLQGATHCLAIHTCAVPCSQGNARWWAWVVCRVCPDITCLL